MTKPKHQPSHKPKEAPAIVTAREYSYDAQKFGEAARQTLYNCASVNRDTLKQAEANNATLEQARTLLASAETTLDEMRGTALNADRNLIDSLATQAHTRKLIEQGISDKQPTEAGSAPLDLAVFAREFERFVRTHPEQIREWLGINAIERRPDPPESKQCKAIHPGGGYRCVLREGHVLGHSDSMSHYWSQSYAEPGKAL
jgi:hypothetical protein